MQYARDLGNPIQWHYGESAVQFKCQVSQDIAARLNSYNSPFMPNQHRQFFNSLPYFSVGTLDSLGRPWASIITGEEGFITSLNENLLKISLVISSDPITRNLKNPFVVNGKVFV